MKYVIFDLDNCLSDDGWRIEKIDWTKANPAERYAPYHAGCSSDTARNVGVFNTYAQTYKVLFFTARPESVREATRQWIEHELGVNCPSISMRGNNDHRPSVDLKRHMLQEFVAMGGAKEDIFIAFDDHEGVLKMYEEEGVDSCRLAIHDRCAYTPPASKLSAPDILKEAEQTFRQRSAIYGDNYKRFGRAFLSIFPDGRIPEIVDSRDMDRLQLLMQMLNKMTRYAENLTKGGHADSARDICVYAAMLEEMTDEK
jgi:hypothetical protein